MSWLGSGGHFLHFQIFLSISFPFPLPLVSQISSQAYPVKKAPQLVSQSLSPNSLENTYFTMFSQAFFPFCFHLLSHKTFSYLHYIGVRSLITWGSLFFNFIKHFASYNILKTANEQAVFYLNGKF